MRLLLVVLLALPPLTVQAQNLSKERADQATPSDHVKAAESHGSQEVVD